MDGEQELEPHLRRAFSVTSKAVEEILALLLSEQTTQVLARLMNYAEQLQCCQRVNLSGTPLGQFEQLAERLQYKICASLQRHVDTMHTAIKQLEDCYTKVMNQQTAIMSTHQQLVQRLTPVALTCGTPFRPPLALMMEWLEDLEQDAFFILLEKRHLVDQLDFRSEQTVEKLNKNWTADHGVGDKLTNIMTHLHFFMAEK